MADEPQHPIEPKLRAWAQSRRLQAGLEFELHPVDRSQLHQEVQRIQGAPVEGESTTAPLWGALFPRLAFIGVLTVLLVLAVLQWLPRQGGDGGSFEVAQSTKEPVSPASVPAPIAAGSEVSNSSTVTRRQPRAERAVDLTAPQASAPRPSPLQPLEPEAAASEPSLVSAQSDLSEGSLPSMVLPETSTAGPGDESPQDLLPRRYGLTVGVSSAASAPPSAKSEVPTMMNSEARGAALQPRTAAREALRETLVITQGFREAGQELPPDWSASLVRRQAARRNFNAPPDVALQSFKVEQRGPFLQVLDADGSLYRGRVWVDPSLEGLPGVQPGVFGGQVFSNGFSFLVAGTNVTSGQTLQFQGLIETGRVVRLQGRALLGENHRIVIEAQEKER